MNLLLHKTNKIISNYIRHVFFTINNAHLEKIFVPEKIECPFSEIISSNPKVSVIITNFNYAEYLKEAIDSALNQTYANKEIIVVDDGSTDDSCEILDKYKQSIIILKQENKGQAAAFNSGYSQCSGDIICFLDADDYWDRHKLQEVVKKFQENKWGMICHDLTIICMNEKNKTEYEFSYSQMINTPIHEGIYYPHFINRESFYIFSPTSGLSISRNIAKDFFPLHEKGWKICADHQIAFCCACLTSIGYINNSLGRYRLHGKNNYLSLKRRRPLDVEIRYLINMMLSYVKLSSLMDASKNPVMPTYNNYRFTRRWLFMTSKINLNLLFNLWKININYYRHNKYVNNKNIAMIKFMFFDTIILCSFFLGIPTRKLKLRNTYIKNFSKEYSEIFTDFITKWMTI